MPHRKVPKAARYLLGCWEPHFRRPDLQVGRLAGCTYTGAMPSSKVTRVFMLFWALITIFETIRAFQDPETREFLAISVVVFAVPIAIGTIVAVVILATRHRPDRLTITTSD